MLDRLKERLKNIKPFLTISLRGKGDVLCEPDEFGKLAPLIITLAEIDLSYIAESGSITNIILRHSKTYKESLQVGEMNLSQAQQAYQEVQDRLGSEEEQLKQIGVFLEVGKRVLIERARNCYYEHAADKVAPVLFVDKDTVAEKDEVIIPFHALKETELFEMGVMLMQALPSQKAVANITMLRKETQLNSDGGIEEVVTAKTVTAPKSSHPLRGLRRVVSKNVSRGQDRGAVGDSGGNEQIGS